MGGCGSRFRLVLLLACECGGVEERIRREARVFGVEMDEGGGMLGLSRVVDRRVWR